MKKFMNRKTMWIIVALVVIILGTYMATIANASTSQCNNNNPKNCPIPTQICDNGKHIGNPHCQPTETPSVTPTSTPGNDGGSTPTNNAPVCTVQLTNSPLLQGEVRNSPTSVTFSWWPLQGGADHYAIIYGYAADKLYFGQSNIEGSQTSITLNDLTPNAQVFAKVTAYKGACSADSGVFSSETMPLGAPATGRAE